MFLNINHYNALKEAPLEHHDRQNIFITKN